MAERGIDISSAESKALDRFLDQRWNYVVTVCDRAREECPFFPGAGERLHWSFPDPSEAAGSEEARLRVFRRTADAIEERIRRWLAGLVGRDPGGSS